MSKKKRTKNAACSNGNLPVYCHHEKRMIAVRECWPCEECGLSSAWPCSGCKYDPCPFSRAKGVFL